jgi:hypothetical protein
MCYSKRFFIDFEHGGTNGYEISGMELTPIIDTLLQSNRASSFPGAALASKWQLREQLPGRLIELPHVPHDVHMAHVIALPGINRAAISN